jgi:hypothetical protein
MVRERGHAPNVLFLFETSSGKYGWLNKVVAYGLGSQTKDGVFLNVWQVSVPTLEMHGIGLEKGLSE